MTQLLCPFFRGKPTYLLGRPCCQRGQSDQDRKGRPRIGARYPARLIAQQSGTQGEVFAEMGSLRFQLSRISASQHLLSQFLLSGRFQFFSMSLPTARCSANSPSTDESDRGTMGRYSNSPVVPTLDSRLQTLDFN